MLKKYKNNEEFLDIQKRIIYDTKDYLLIYGFDPLFMESGIVLNAIEKSKPKKVMAIFNEDENISGLEEVLKKTPDIKSEIFKTKKEIKTGFVIYGGIHLHLWKYNKEKIKREFLLYSGPLLDFAESKFDTERVKILFNLD